MKTVKATSQQFYSVETNQGDPKIPKGVVRVHTVQYRTFDISEEEFGAMTFEIHDANSKEAKAIAGLVKPS